jgi:hypothetical protein
MGDIQTKVKMRAMRKSKRKSISIGVLLRVFRTPRRKTKGKGFRPSPVYLL